MNVEVMVAFIEMFENMVEIFIKVRPQPDQIRQEGIYSILPVLPDKSLFPFGK